MTKEKITMPKVLPSLSGEESSRYWEIGRAIKDIKSLISCPTSIYKKLYDTTLFNIAEFCQAMPYSEKDFHWDYGFLIRQLTLTTAALKLRRGILLPKSTGAESIAAEEAQWTYAIFSASLVNNFYHLEQNRIVYQYQPQGNLIDMWSPMMGSLYKRAFYYSMRFVPSNTTTKRDVFMAAVSQHIFPTFSVKWLSTNNYLFNQWWDTVLHQSAAHIKHNTIT